MITVSCLRICGEIMAKFFDLKKAMFFPRIAGFMRSKKDVPYLLDLLENERKETRISHATAAADCRKAGHIKSASRIEADWRLLDKVYEHDISLCMEYMQQEGIGRI